MQLTDPVAEAAMDLGTDSDSSGSELTDDILEAIQAAEQTVASDPGNYDAHVSLVELLSHNKVRERLRSAREVFAAKFPLTEQLWLAWIADTLDEVAQGAVSPDVLLSLAEQSLQDYLSVSLWQQYLTVAKAVHPVISQDRAEGAAVFRAAAERALTACGMHIAAAGHLHALICETEAEFAAAAIEASGADSAEATQAVDAACAAWERWATAPVIGTADALTGYQEWLQGLPDGLRREVPERIPKAMKRAQAAVQLRQAFEDGIADDRDANEDLLAAFMQYIRFERSQTPAAPRRIRVLLERAVARFPVTVELWRMLTAHVEAEAAAAAGGAPALADLRGCCQRACRNCPWCGELWAAQLRAVELEWHAVGGGTAEVAGVAGWEMHSRLYSTALTVGLATESDYVHAMSARLVACGRFDSAKLRQDGKAARDLLVQYFPDAVDAHANLTDTWATLEAKSGRADEARAVCWAPLLQSRAAQVRWDLQKRYAWWEVQWGSIAKLREFYRELLARKRGALPAAARRGAAAAWVHAEERYGGIREEMEARRALHALTVAVGVAGEGEGEERRPGAAEQGAGEGGKRKHGATAEAGQGQGQGEDQVAKRAKGAAASGAGDGVGSGKGEAGKPADAAKAERTYDDTLTVFVKHLHERVTEADLKDLFEDATDIRLLLKQGGLSKGCAYIQFASDEAVEKALEKHSMLWFERHIFVARSRPPGQRDAGGRGGRGRPDRGRGRGRVDGRRRGDGRGQGRGGGRGGSPRGGGGRHRGGGCGAGRRQGLGFSDAPDEGPSTRPRPKMVVGGSGAAAEGGGSGAGSAGGGGPPKEATPKDNAKFKAMFGL
eukprot:jgi/Ulvmu1/8303/UM042_0008.1